MRSNSLLLAFACFMLGSSPIISAIGDFVVLESTSDRVVQIISGKQEQVQRKISPASTFKIVIAWAGLEEDKVTPLTRYKVKDRHVPQTPREINLHEAMYYSSNDYFVWLAKR